ncbi:hypothetical protein [Shewanella sp. Arc9-LZ]|uniref:hypothetical protein n=1 Tax=Shewanella sp. Arc9-LZ TaxID=2698686 RepID=UPI00137B9916|nr:hypothetical protein [Shewanella sp. Arc9-LZ]QHS13186.1 hypothetical protein GUY17_08710 [Shewanella sp. Arc9-LZ]
MDRKILTFIIAMMANPVIAEVYKCADGKYQADPCDEQSLPLDLSGVGSVVSQSGDVGIVESESSPTISDKSDTKSAAKKQNFSAYLRKQKIERLIKNLEQDKKKAFISRDRRIAQLRSKGNRANNNLAGATWQQSLAQEMTAVMQQANTEVESIDREIASLRDELKQL